VSLDVITGADIANWFGFPLHLVTSFKDIRWIGSPPGAVCFDLSGALYVLRYSTSSDVLHEVCHAVLGPDTLKEETGLMAYEYACARALLKGNDWKGWRKDFAHYVFDWDDHEEIGRDDEVFSSEEWVSHCYLDALDRGWLQDNGCPIQFHGLHEGYASMAPPKCKKDSRTV